MSKFRLQILAGILYVATTAGIIVAVFSGLAPMLVGAIAVLGYGIATVCWVAAFRMGRV